MLMWPLASQQDHYSDEIIKGIDSNVDRIRNCSSCIITMHWTCLLKYSSPLTIDYRIHVESDDLIMRQLVAIATLAWTLIEYHQLDDDRPSRCRCGRCLSSRFDKQRYIFLLSDTGFSDRIPFTRRFDMYWYYNNNYVLLVLCALILFNV